jgi:adenylate cyclase
MAVEIERKFLVKNDGWRTSSKGTQLKQGYLFESREKSVRIRIAEDVAFLTIKSKTEGIRRKEYEYAIPVADAKEMMDSLCDERIIEKIRYRIMHANHLWEIDEFLGKNKGLVLAEIELKLENESFDPPEWLGQEVSTDPNFYNSRLASHPFTKH